MTPRLLVCLLAIALLTPLSAAYTPTINNLSISSDTYVIDSDASRAGAAYDRNTIATTSNVSFAGNGSTDYRYDYQLLDKQGNPVLLKNGSGGTTTTFQGASFTISGAVGKSVTDRFAPAVTLKSGIRYKVRLLIKRAFPGVIYNTQKQANSDPQQFIHFTNTSSNDAAVNVRASITAINWVKAFACDTDPNNTSFTASATLQLHRYDHYLATTPGSDIISHRLSYELVDASDNSIVAIQSNSTTPGYTLDEHATSGATEIPYTRSVTREFSLLPGVQLDSVNKTYLARVTLSHEETAGNYLIDHLGKNGPASTLLHYNGTVIAEDDNDEIILTSIAGDPSTSGYLPLGNPPTRLSTLVKIDAAHISGAEAWSLGFISGDQYPMILYPDGSCRFESSSTIDITAPESTDVGTVAGVRFQRTNMFFNNQGLQGGVRVFLPAGLGAYLGKVDAPSNHVLESVIDAGDRYFDQDLTPETTLITLGSPDPGKVWHIREETKPVEIIAFQILWAVNTGGFAPGFPVPGSDRARYVRHFEYEFLSAAPIPAEDKVFHSNELYYQFINPTPIAATSWSTDANGTAQLNASFAIEPGSFISHFPSQALLSWTSPGTIEISADLVTPANSSLPDADIVSMDFTRSCDDSCGSIPNAIVKLDPSGNSFGFTRDGGIGIAGSYITGSSRRNLVIGYIDSLSTTESTIYAHSTSAFSDARFLMPGHFLSGGDLTQDPNDGPGALLNSGYDPADLSVPERPGSAAYLVGIGDYAGMNYRVAEEIIPPTASSVLGGEQTPSYTLGNRSKYYTRLGGVTGIHEPTANPFAGSVMIYGYEFDFSAFGLSFIDSLVHDSVTAGSLDIPSPSNFTLAFDPLFFDCLGGLTTAEIADGTFSDRLEFWDADFTGISAHFQPAIGAQCDPSEANLVLGIRTFGSNIQPALSASLGFHPEGTLITAADARLEGIDSRLNLPASLNIAGPNDEEYHFFPTHDAYYENSRHSSSTVGGLSFVGLLDVPFFEDLEVHFQTGTDEENTTDNIYMMGGWPGEGEITAGSFDLDNRSYPSGTTLDAYRSLDHSDHRIHAVQNWLGVVPFDYELDWDTTTRAFIGAAPVTNDLLVLSTEHQLTYLSAENAELDFGASLELSIPEINLSNIAIDLVENTGVLSALETAISEELSSALISGMDASSELLNDRMDAFYDRIFAASIDPIIDTLYDELDDFELIIGGPSRNSIIADYLCNRADSVTAKLQTIDGSVGETGSIIDEIDTSLARLQIAIRSVIGRVEVSAGQVVISSPELSTPEDAATTAGGVLREGIFADTDDDGYQLTEILTAALIEELTPEIAANLSSVIDTVGATLAEQLDNELDSQFEQAAPTIEQIKMVLMDVHNAIYEIRDSARLYDEISALMATESANIQNAGTAAKDEVTAFFLQNDYDEYSETEIKELIRNAVRDHFNASPVIASIQAILKSYIYDLDATINQAISSGFGEINRIIARLLDDALPHDSSLTGMLGDVADISAVGSIDGYAHINGDALRTLRLDASLQLKLPDDFEFSGYLEINQLDSDGDGSCSFAGEGEYAAEVLMGATDIPVAWSGDGLRFDVGTKFTFDTTNNFALRGFGGSLEMTQGEIGFETMAITSLGAAAMFGKDENYLAAQVGLKFDSYELSGGIFFGRTCTAEPLELVDPDVTKVLGPPPFTGIYAYGEAQIPIVNIGCLFNLSAKAGAGVFWFEEGNTYGGKMLVGATGRALCAVGVGGELTLIGSKSGNNYSFFGRGRVWGEIGVCPLCTSFSEQVELTYKNDKWSYDY